MGKLTAYLLRSVYEFVIIFISMGNRSYIFQSGIGLGFIEKVNNRIREGKVGYFQNLSDHKERKHDYDHAKYLTETQIRSKRIPSQSCKSIY